MPKDDVIRVGHYDNWPIWMLRWWIRTLEGKLHANSLAINKILPNVAETERKAHRAANHLHKHKHLLDSVDNESRT